MVQLEELTTIAAPIERCFHLARSVEVHLAGNTHWGESAIACGGVTSGLIGLRQTVTWRAKHFGVWQTLSSQITALDVPVYFRDEMVEGIFRFMRHDHYFEPAAQESTVMRDVFCFAAPLSLLGRVAELLFLRRYMQALLHERNQVIKQIAESNSWQQYLPTTKDILEPTA